MCKYFNIVTEMHQMFQCRGFEFEHVDKTDSEFKLPLYQEWKIQSFPSSEG